jgi:hypothetical protein
MAKGPTRSLDTRYSMGNSTVPVQLALSSTDSASGVTIYELQQSVDGGPFSDVAALGGYVRYASALGAMARFSFTGKNVAWVAATGSNRGKAEVWVDGV